MSDAREKRLLLGALAFLAPIPLPFNEVLEWPVLGVYLALVALFLRRAARETPAWLPLWAMNLLAVAYLPFAWVDFRFLSGGQIVRPLLHVGLFALTVKLWALRKESEKWHVVLGLFVVFLAAMGTAVHPTILIYLAAFVSAMLVVLVRFASAHVLGAFGRAGEAAPRLPLGRYLAATCLFALLVAVPLFAVLPRVRTPLAFGGGSGLGTEIASTGFSDSMTLDVASRVRENRAVAMRLAYDGPLPPGHEIRYRAASYDLYRDRTDGRRGWRHAPPTDRSLRRSRGGSYVLAPDVASRGSVRIWLEPLGIRSLPMPADATYVSILTPYLERDRGGTLSLSVPPSQIVEYKVWLAGRPTLDTTVPAGSEDDAAALDLTGVTPRMAELATTVMGQGTPAERARRLERYFVTQFDYTLDFVGRDNVRPIEDFLFKYRSGHCELFASSMVLLLRSQGIPARLVTGFLGAEYNPLEGYYVVRQANAHAWVEAWVDGTGWTVFDPTPPDGRPTVSREGLGLLISQLSDWVLFRWDRYVLSYGFEDQMETFRRLRRLWNQIVGELFGDRDRRPQAPEASPATAQVPVEEVSAVRHASTVAWVLGGLAATAAAIVLAIWWRRRPRLDATRAYQRLRHELRRRDRSLDAAVAPLEVARRVAVRVPELGPAANEVVRQYLRESYGGESLDDAERTAVAEALRASVEGLRKAG